MEKSTELSYDDSGGFENEKNKEGHYSCGRIGHKVFTGDKVFAKRNASDCG